MSTANSNDRSFRLRFALAIAVGALLLTAGPAVKAQGHIDLRGGVYSDAEGGFLGGGWLGRLATTKPWFVNPNLEYVFGDRVDRVTLNADVQYDLYVSRKYAYWLGGGPALIRSDPDFGSNDNDVGLNFLAGLGARQGKIRPFVQGKVTLADDNEAVVAAGIRF